jgi:addiction module RelB/DinJ family antitoxin
MERTLVRARIDQRIKQEAEAVLAAIGLRVSDAVRLMMVRIVQDKALPFKPPILAKPKPIQKKEFDMSRLVMPAMRQHVAGRTHDPFGLPALVTRRGRLSRDLDPASTGSRCRRGHSARPAVQPALRRLFSNLGQLTVR